jgi:hypothetical protein
MELRTVAGSFSASETKVGSTLQKRKKLWCCGFVQTKKQTELAVRVTLPALIASRAILNLTTDIPSLYALCICEFLYRHLADVDTTARKKSTQTPIFV